MGTVMRFGRFLVTCNYFRFMQIRNASLHYPSLRVRNIKKPKNVEEIPEIDKLWTQYKGMKIAENNFKMELLDELILESLVDKSYISMHYFEKIILIQSSVDSLKKRNVVPSVNNLVDALLSHLETFPFDNGSIKQDENELSIKLIRNAIEKQYLAWKFKLDLVDLEEILHRYRLCLYEFRSLGNMRRNIRLLEKFTKTSKPCVAEKIYHINQKPFEANCIGNFQDTIAGLNWQLFPQYCPKILQHSHQYIMFVISILRDMNFTEKQIQEGLPFLHFTFENFIRRLNKMLTSPQIAQHRQEEKFLHLLSYSAHILQDLVNLRKATFHELTDLVTVSSKTLTGRVRLITVSAIMYHINQFYKISSSYGKMIKKHSKYKLVREKEVLDTVTFLKRANFTVNEIAESITIVLYPRNQIEKTLKHIYSQKSTLEKYGFKHGCVAKQTHHFKHGTKEKQKILQLCLYYLEKPYHFTGDGIWGSADIAETNPVESDNSSVNS